MSHTLNRGRLAPAVWSLGYASDGAAGQSHRLTSGGIAEVVSTGGPLHTAECGTDFKGQPCHYSLIEIP